MPLHVLFVCTGNVCRSPMAELMFRAGAVDDGSVLASSAGVGALVGDPVDEASATALREYGVDPDGHRARQFEPWMATQAGLVLTAQRTHRDTVMEQVPEAFRRTFTLREFARLAAAIRRAEPDAGPYTVVARAAAGRAMFGAVPLAADDIADPYRRDVAYARGTARRVLDSVQVALSALSAARPAVVPVPLSSPARPPAPRPAAPVPRGPHAPASPGSAPRPPAARPSASHPSASHPSASHPSVAGPSAPRPPAAHPSTSHPSAARPSAPRPSAPDSSAPRPRPAVSVPAGRRPSPAAAGPDPARRPRPDRS